MRLRDGIIYETEWGLMIRQEAGHFASCTMVTWSSLFFLGDRELINEVITRKIEDNQQRLKLYQQTEMRFNATKEAADELKEIINHNPILQ